MKAWVWKCVSFDAAHALPLHGGKCRNLHGHTYFVELGVLRDIDPTMGIAIDFGELDDFLEVNVVARFDHSNLNDKLPGLQPTAENIAHDILEHAENCFTPVKVRVFETPNCWVEVSSEE